MTRKLLLNQDCVSYCVFYVRKPLYNTHNSIKKTGIEQHPILKILRSKCQAEESADLPELCNNGSKLFLEDSSYTYAFVISRDIYETFKWK